MCRVNQCTSKRADPVLSDDNIPVSISFILPDWTKEDEGYCGSSCYLFIFACRQSYMYFYAGTHEHCFPESSAFDATLRQKHVMYVRKYLLKACLKEENCFVPFSVFVWESYSEKHRETNCIEIDE